MTDILNENFVVKYAGLKGEIYELRGEWQFQKKVLVNQLRQNVAETTDFIWQALTMSLVSKMIYNYAPEDYFYISNYIDWKADNRDIFSKFYPHSFRRMTDSVFEHLPEKLILAVRDHSVNNMELYTDFLISIFNHFDSDLVGIESQAILERAINDEYFTKEFSDDQERLSNLYLNSLIRKISKQKQSING